jgi:predicted lipoprotein
MEKPNPQPVKLEGWLSQISLNAMVWNLSAEELLNTTQKYNCSDQGCPVLAMATTARRICTEIENFELRACIQVWDYINNTKMEQIIWTMVKSMHKSFQEFISGIKNGFIDLEYV